MILNHGAFPLLGASLGMRSYPNLADPSGVNSEFSTLLVHKLFSFTYYQVDALGFHPALLLLSYLPESSRPHLHLFCLPLASCSVLDVPLVLRFSLLYLCIFNMKSFCYMFTSPFWLSYASCCHCIILLLIHLLFSIVFAESL